eukprot:gene603-biopygen9177
MIVCHVHSIRRSCEKGPRHRHCRREGPSLCSRGWLNYRTRQAHRIRLPATGAKDNIRDNPNIRDNLSMVAGLRNIKEHQGTSRNIKEHQGTSRNIKEHQGTLRNIKEH